MNKVAEKLGFLAAKIEDKVTLVNITLCEKPDDQQHHSMICLRRDCEQGGVKVLQEKLGRLMKDTAEVSWNRWEMT